MRPSEEDSGESALGALAPKAAVDGAPATAAPWTYHDGGGEAAGK